MGPYDPVEHLARLIMKLENEREFGRVGGLTIAEASMVYKGINLLAQAGNFNEDIQEWRQKSTDLKKRSGFKTFYYQAHQ